MMRLLCKLALLPARSARWFAANARGLLALACLTGLAWGFGQFSAGLGAIIPCSLVLAGLVWSQLAGRD